MDPYYTPDFTRTPSSQRERVEACYRAFAAARDAEPAVFELAILIDEHSVRWYNWDHMMFKSAIESALNIARNILQSGYERIAPDLRGLVQILHSHARRNNITYAELIGPSRRRQFIIARHAAWIEAAAAGYGASTIARACGKRDHSTILNAIRKGHP